MFVNIKQAQLDKIPLPATVEEIMNTWTLQMGFPVINIKQTNNNSFIISQSHFLLDSSAKPTESSPYKY